MSTLSRVTVVIGLMLASISLAQAEEFKPPQLTKAEVREMHWLAVGIYFEARNQPIAGQLRVAEVILNRRDSRHRGWPNTIEEVVRQGEVKLYGCQFSFVCDGKPKEIKEEEKFAWALAKDIAFYFILQEKRGQSREPSCIHSYHADYATNISYFSKLTREEKVGDHIFFCD